MALVCTAPKAAGYIGNNRSSGTGRISPLANSNQPLLAELVFVLPRAQQEAFVLSAVWTGLGLNVGQVGIAAEAGKRQLRDQANGDK
jgi:hypothetical protein